MKRSCFQSLLKLLMCFGFGNSYSIMHFLNIIILIRKSLTWKQSKIIIIMMLLLLMIVALFQSVVERLWWSIITNPEARLWSEVNWLVGPSNLSYGWTTVLNSEQPSLVHLRSVLFHLKERYFSLQTDSQLSITTFNSSDVAKLSHIGKSL